jgi:adenylate cyclase
MAEHRRRLAAIMFTDMVGYSALAQVDEAAALATLDRHNRMLRPLFAQFSGREIKTVGDAFLVEFDSALDAARCAIEIQRRLHDYNADVPDSGRILIRIGLHVGDVVVTDGDVLGDAVNIASRIEPLAGPGGICLSQQVYDQVQNKVSLPLARLPTVALKNIHVPMQIYRIVQPWEGASHAGGPAGLSALGRQIAVLPLSNISPDPNDGYFADGLTEEIIAQLSQVRGLSVIARTSVMPYKTAPKSIAEVGAELGVDTVLEGSVRKAGDRIRITLQLIDVATQRHVWANSYNRQLDDVFSVQTDIAERTAAALRLELTKAEGVEASYRPTSNLEAYDLYLRGLAASSDPAGGGLEEASRCFEQATQLDPKFADAFAAWAELYVRSAADYLPVREAMPKARTYAARALELDPNSSDAHAALGNIAEQFDHDWARAEAEFREAIRLNPSNVVAHGFLALDLVALGRFEDAKEQLREAVRLDPAGRHHSTLAWVDFESGDFEAAGRIIESDLAKDPDSLPNHTFAGMFYLVRGRTDLAVREATTPVPPKNEVERFDHALLRGLVGHPEDARAILAEFDRGEAKLYIGPADRAMLYSVIGETSRALDLLEEDHRNGDQILWLYHRGIFFDPIREDPRFPALVEQYGVPLGIRKNRLRPAA